MRGTTHRTQVDCPARSLACDSLNVDSTSSFWCVIGLCCITVYAIMLAKLVQLGEHLKVCCHGFPFGHTLPKQGVR